MKYSFDELVNARANERVQKKVALFRKSILRAIEDLGPQFHDPYKKELPPLGTEALMRVAEDEREGWPPCLWEDERKVVSAELLATMDAMQQAIIAASRNDLSSGDRPADSDPTTKEE
jgi:hypothetical protein